jgi:hypothetical protein
LRGRQNHKLRYAMLAAAAFHGGTERDLLKEVTWRQADDFWHYAPFAAVAYVRAAASRANVPVRQACQELAKRPGTQRHSSKPRHREATHPKMWESVVTMDKRARTAASDDYGA